MKIITELNPKSDEIGLLEKKLFQHNCNKIKHYAYDQFILKAVDDSNSIFAGIYCKMGGHWLYIESLWVDPKHRAQGLGKKLLSRAEKIAIEKNCYGVYLYTYSFQNPGFYKKFGYHVFGALENFYNEHSKLYMKKILVYPMADSIQPVLNIRKIKDTDCKNLTALSIQVWLHTYAKDGIRDSFSTYILNQFTPEYFKTIADSQTQKLYIATIKGHLVGYICIDLKAKIDDTKAYEIVTLYVQEHFQKKGVGTKLIEHITKEHGPKQWLTTWTYNDNAIQFYRHLGFVPVGETYFEFDNERHKNLIFKKN